MLNRANLVAFGLVCALTLAVGCSSQTQGEKMVESFARTRETLVKAQNQVDTTMITLLRLRQTRGEDLKDIFPLYKDAVAELEAQGISAKRQAAGMKEQEHAYIMSWQEEMKNINDPNIKATLQSRQQAVRSNFKLVQMYADGARKAFDPFLKGNKEIVQALSIDLSPPMVVSLAPAMDRAYADGQALKQRIAALRHALDSMANGASPIGH